MTYLTNLRRYAASLTHNKDDADDLVNSVVLHALEKQHLFHPDTDLRAWLITMMYHTFINERRRDKFRNRISAEIDEADTLPDYRMPDRRLAIRDLERCMKYLGDHEKWPVMMKASGFRYEEIADKLDIPMGTVRSRLHRGRQKLREKMEQTQ